MDDPYATLGVPRTASADDIRRAYRALAKKHHPDLNPGNKEAEARFKQVAAASDLLSDPEKRARFDRGEIDMFGQQQAPSPGYRDYAEGAAGRSYASNGAPSGAGSWNDEELHDIFGSLFGDAARQARGPRPGHDERYQLQISFLDAVSGATRRLTLPDGRTLDVKIPPGTSEGQTLRLRAQGGAGTNGAPAGDALIEIAVAPHPFFERIGDDIRLELPVTVPEAVLGATIEVPTPGGPVKLRIPAHSDAGNELRLRDRGVPAHAGRPAGHVYVRLKIVIGTTDPAFEDFLRDWKHPAANPRAAMEGAP